MKANRHLLLGLSLLLAGCAGHPFSAAKKAGIHTIQLDPIVADHDMRYGVDTSKLGSSKLDDDLRATISNEMVNDVGAEGLRRMRIVMRRHSIDVLQMIHGQVENRLHSDLGFTITEQPPADAVCTVKIVQYGYDDTPFSLMHELPFVILKIELKDNTGHVILSRQTKYYGPTDDDSGASWDEYEAHPDELRDAWNSKIAEAVDRLIPASK